jgi:hypothetical protein
MKKPISTKTKITELLFMDSEAAWNCLRDFFRTKIAVQNSGGIMGLINSNVTDSLSEDLKIFSAGIVIIICAITVGNNEFISTAHSDQTFESGIPKDDQMISNTLDGIENGKMNTKALVDYKLKSTETICEEDKTQKKSSDLCGKDNEEMIQKIEKENLQKKMHAVISRPRVIKPSCAEKNYGHPSMSDTKGKHMDEDCCPDPDEWPKPGCRYDAHGYSIMLSGPKH